MKQPSSLLRVLPLILAGFISTALFSQTTITLGTPDIEGNQFSIEAPYSFEQRTLRSQSLISAVELTSEGLTSGEITHIGFQVATHSINSELQNFTIRMGSPDADFGVPFETGLSEVLSPHTYSPQADWNMHSLDVPYIWDGVSDIVVETCYSNEQPGPPGQANTLWYSFDFSPRYKETDFNFGQNACTAVNSEDQYNLRPRLQLTWQPLSQAPDASFNILNYGACSGHAVFQDDSDFQPESWLWYFGDGNTSPEQNPSHTYTQSGSYSVSLVVSNAHGTDSIGMNNIIEVNLSATTPTTPFCTPGTQNTDFGLGVTSVSLNGTSYNSQNGSVGYEDLTCDLFEINQDETYLLTFDVDGESNNHISCWIDYNGDGSFSEDELLLSAVSNNGVLSQNISPSNTALTDSVLRFRIMSDLALLGQQSPCAEPQVGQVEDYSIRIISNTEAPEASFTFSPSLSCDGLVQFNDESENVPSSWFWQFGDGNFSTSPSPEHTYSSSGTYTVSLTVQNSFGQDDTVMTNVITVDLDQQLVSACIPQTISYCCGYGILSFEFAGIDTETNDAQEGYLDLSCGNVAEVVEGESYNIQASLGTENAHDFHLFIDFNNDGVFNGSELVYSALNTTSINDMLSIPQTVPLEETRLRMRILADFVGNGNNGCLDLQYGQAEDYTIIISPNTDPPNADFSAVNTFSCNGNIQFIDQSYNAEEYIWYFGDGQSSSEINPIHTYGESGQYTVSLVVNNPYGQDSLAIEDFITIDFDAACDTISMPNSGIGSTLTDCVGFLADDGGPYGTYTNNSTSTQTIQVAEGNRVRLEFSSFDYQTNMDYLIIYDGPNSGSPIIGQYTGFNLPNSGVIESSENAITLVQTTNFFGQLDGFILEWSCIPVGISEYKSEAFQVFPNPASDYLHIQARTGLFAKSIRLIDALGRTTYRSELRPMSQTISLSSVPAGNYIVEIIAEEQSFTYPLIIR